MTRRFERLVLVLAAGTALAGFAQTTGHRNPPLTIRSLAGRDLFEFYCATCHGRDGRGNGPAAAALKVPPSDLTLLARRGGGVFPRQRAEAFITSGGNVLTPAHGSSDMPVWGPVFRALDPSDAMVKIRISSVVAYIESIQVR